MRSLDKRRNFWKGIIYENINGSLLFECWFVTELMFQTRTHILLRWTNYLIMYLLCLHILLSEVYMSLLHVRIKWLKYTSDFIFQSTSVQWSCGHKIHNWWKRSNAHIIKEITIFCMRQKPKVNGVWICWVLKVNEICLVKTVDFFEVFLVLI